MCPRIKVAFYRQPGNGKYLKENENCQSKEGSSKSRKKFITLLQFWSCSYLEKQNRLKSFKGHETEPGQLQIKPGTPDTASSELQSVLLKIRKTKYPCLKRFHKIRIPRSSFNLPGHFFSSRNVTVYSYFKLKLSLRLLEERATCMELFFSWL